VALVEEDEQLLCAACGRTFSRAGGALNLLPPGVAPPASHYLSGLDNTWKRRFIEHIYARHNHAPIIAHAVSRVVEVLDDQTWGLNLGSGHSMVHKRLINLDISNNLGVQVLGDAHRLPFQSSSLSCIISQEVFEHLHSPGAAVGEAHRVLRPGGMLFIQVPFIIGAHSLPHDYWRFTGAGLTELVTGCGFEIVECRPAGGAGTSMYRISTEFVATVAASMFGKLYLPAKALAALVLSPVRLVDRFTTCDGDANRIPCGFYCIARKVEGQPVGSNVLERL
jgi:SAM-dependent methyltransferase